MPGSSPQGIYRIRIRSGDIELEVEAPNREFVESKVPELLGWMGFDVPEVPYQEIEVSDPDGAWGEPDGALDERAGAWASPGNAGRDAYGSPTSTGDAQDWVAEGQNRAIGGQISGAEGQNPAARASTTSGKPPSLVEHVRSVAPNGGVEYVLAVGYYLENHKGMTGGFRRRDLGQAFNLIKYTHSNPGVPIAAGRKQGLLMDGVEVDKIRLSETADEWVRARLRGE